MKKFGIGCLAVIGGLVVLSVVGALIAGGGARSSTLPSARAVPAASAEAVQVSAGEPSVESAPAEQPAPAAENYAIGQDVAVDQVRWKVLSAEDAGNTLSSDNQFIDDKTTSGRFVRVRVELENLSKDMLSYGGFELVDEQGREYTRYSEAFGFIPTEEACVLENLNPNITRVCTEVFEVPAEATSIQARLGDLKVFGSKEALVDLGLSAQ